MFKFEQLEKDLTEMYSVSNSGNVNSELVKKLIGEFFSARNDLVFLHISIKGSNFNELHTLLNEYYDHTDSDIDALLELYVSVFKKSFNLNEFHFSSEIVKDKYNCQEIDDGKQLFFDYYSMRYFESTMEEVLKAEMEVNRLLQEHMYVDINTFYDLLDLDPIDLDDEIGWSIEAGVVWQGYSWIAFEHEIVEVDGGMECCIITMNTDPTTDTMDEYH